MKKPYLLLLAVACLAAFSAGCGKSTTNSNAEDNNPVVNQALNLNEALDLNVTTNDDLNTNTTIDENANVAIDDNTNTATPTNTNTAVVSNTNTSTTNTNIGTTSDTISITGPAANTELVSPFYVEGTVTSGTQVFARLKASGVTIFTEPISVHNKAFKGKLLFDFSHTTSGTIEVFQKDAAGNETGLTSVPVKFNLAAATNSNANTNTAATTNTNTGY